MLSRAPTCQFSERMTQTMQLKSTAQVLEQIKFELRPVMGGHIHLRVDKTRRTRRVNLEPFLLAQYAVTHEVYALSGHAYPPELANHPITDVSWFDAIDFCNLLSQISALEPCYTILSAEVVEFHAARNGYRLPTEAEWQWACMAGTTAPKDLDASAWYLNNSSDSPHAVGQKQPNDWGLYDMIGNVWEWCWDLFDPEIYGTYRVFRGGGWLDAAHACRASSRRKSHPTFKIDDLGFRLARSHP